MSAIDSFGNEIYPYKQYTTVYPDISMQQKEQKQKDETAQFAQVEKLVIEISKLEETLDKLETEKHTLEWRVQKLEEAKSSLKEHTVYLEQQLKDTANTSLASIKVAMDNRYGAQLKLQEKQITNQEQLVRDLTGQIADLTDENHTLKDLAEKTMAENNLLIEECLRLRANSTTTSMDNMKASAPPMVAMNQYYPQYQYQQQYQPEQQSYQQQYQPEQQYQQYQPEQQIQPTNTEQNKDSSHCLLSLHP